MLKIISELRFKVVIRRVDREFAMEQLINPKVNIYKSMIQYFLDSTDYSLKRIAHLSNSSIQNIQAIYRYNEMPEDFKEELDLVRLYLMILDLEKRRLDKRGFNLYSI